MWQPNPPESTGTLSTHTKRMITTARADYCNKGDVLTKPAVPCDPHRRTRNQCTRHFHTEMLPNGTVVNVSRGMEPSSMVMDKDPFAGDTIAGVEHTTPLVVAKLPFRGASGTSEVRTSYRGQHWPSLDAGEGGGWQNSTGYQKATVAAATTGRFGNKGQPWVANSFAARATVPLLPLDAEDPLSANVLGVGPLPPTSRVPHTRESLPTSTRIWNI